MDSKDRGHRQGGRSTRKQVYGCLMGCPSRALFLVPLMASGPPWNGQVWSSTMVSSLLISSTSFSHSVYTGPGKHGPHAPYFQVSVS